ncbi:MAG: type I glutamate--ammonia ligase [Candidatus Diapherotrites archaeon]
MAENKKFLEKVASDKANLIELQFTDIFGTIKSVTITAERLEEVIEKGAWFDGSSIEGFVRIHESDMFLKPDISTYSLIPWKIDEKCRSARIICDVHVPGGGAFEGDPRNILKMAVGKAEDMGYLYNVGPELEFFLFEKANGKPRPVPHDVGGYFDFAPKDLASDVRRDIIFALQKLGLQVETSHHEVAPGQHEIDFKYGGAVSTADNVVSFKYAGKSIAQIHDLYASFMPKPLFGVNGSGMHVHQSLFDIKTEKNVFFDANDKYKLSKTAKHFIAGQLKHAKAIAALVAPTVNSYKRLVPGYEAPVYICWGQVNRSALIRIPRYSKGREESTRAELRCPDPSANPYLAFAAMLTAGLDGIEKEIELADAVEEDVYGFDDSKLKELNIDTLPGSLYESLQELKKDRVIFDSLGNHAKETYYNAKMKEWDRFRIQVTDWELGQYFDVL